MKAGELFPSMVQVVPEGIVGAAEVEHFTVSEEQSRMTALRGGREFVPAGRYARLLTRGRVHQETMMSDTPYERRTNAEVVRQARGRVLIAGYGLGMILTAIVPKREVREVVVIEKSADVIALVDPAVRAFLGTHELKLTVIHADVFEARSQFGRDQHRTFDVIYFDIWAGMSTDELAAMAILTRRYAALKAPGGWVGCWDREWLRYRKSQERRLGW